MRLFAKWAPGQDATEERPYEIRWEDGRTATMQDYKDHFADHQTFMPDRGSGASLVMFTRQMANVRFNQRIKKWVYTTPAKDRVVLDLTDPNATDDEINEAIAIQAVFIPNREGKIHRAKKRKAAPNQRSKGASG